MKRIKVGKIGKEIIAGNNYGEHEIWKDTCYDLQSIIDEKQDKCYFSEHQNKENNKYWFVEVKNFGWKKISGHKCIIGNKAEDILSILPDTECDFKIHNCGKGIAIQNFHHDSNTGSEWYTVTPISKYTYNRYIRNGGKFEQ